VLLTRLLLSRKHRGGGIFDWFTAISTGNVGRLAKLAKPPDPNDPDGSILDYLGGGRSSGVAGARRVAATDGTGTSTPWIIGGLAAVVVVGLVVFGKSRRPRRGRPRTYRKPPRINYAAYGVPSRRR